MPRINEKKTREKKALIAQLSYVGNRFGPDVHVNWGWFVDEVEEATCSKVYGHGYVTTYWEDPTTHHFQPL